MNSTDLKEHITKVLKNCGADLVRFGNPAEMSDPALFKIFPGCKSVICVAFRLLRGTRRGVEDGTMYYQYTTGVETLEEVLIPGALLRGSCALEEAGFEACPQRRFQLVMQEDSSTNFEMAYDEIFRGRKEETLLDFEKCAVECGLGEAGLSGSVLTDEFGPNQRWGFILTDAVFPYDEKVKPHLCDKCMKCVQGCPGHALSAEGKRDPWQCAAYYKGASRKKNPFMPPDAFADLEDHLRIIAGEADLSMEKAKEVMDRIRFYPPGKHGMVTSMCGRNCDTECYVHLEEKGVLTRKFRTPFRKRPVWSLPVEEEI